MLNKNMSKQKIEDFLATKGDFVKIDYLNRFLKENIPHDMKKFVYSKLALIYEKNNMFANAAKMYDVLALASIVYSEKIKSYVKESEVYIKGGFFSKADEAMKKAMAEANAVQRNEIYIAVKNFYKKQAEVHEREIQRNRAAKIYEKLLEMSTGEIEKQEIKEKLLKLYNKLGKFREAEILKKLR
ncbi:MAG: hypothetical protein ABH804_01045 [archaeon]